MAIRLTSAEKVLKGVMKLWHGKADLPGVAEFGVVRGALDLSLAEGWRQEWWHDLMRVEERYFRANWLAASSYNKTAEVYDAATQDYFQALRDGVTGAGQSPTDAAGAERSAYWARCRNSYSGANWASGVAYAVGDIRFYPVTNRYYQCHTAHTSDSNLVPDATGGNERWGVLTPFERYVDLDAAGQTAIGDVMDVTDRNPRVESNWRGIRWITAQNRVYVLDEEVRCWVTFRQRMPRLVPALDTFDAGDTYASGAQVYWDNGGASTGDFYQANATTTAGQDPTDTPAKWDRIELPEFLEGYLIYATYAKCLTGDDREDKAPGAMQMANGYLELEADNIYRQQGQSPNMAVRTY
jgi:hypothetical protein